ncbi:MAG: ABC transporter ATP-binding protein/permease [Oscillospiraceae bacterium]|jgi:putative ABC transport system permease protein|nr:ABC transporter ATP-binding protein/permease [Oscillospiraceae bacterium]
MLKLSGITKVYTAGDNAVQALRGIDLTFRESEFVSVLGPSGCGKTTLLNIIGGLDRFTQGDLVINGTSTTKFRDRDWDAYRNNSVGFVFQTYNLIAHQSVISNVELALTLSGVGKSERRERAKTVLERVGLADQMYKKPNQLSGGQMQRVAIARALINDPDILLADEPTGALDSETSVQIMELLREIAQGKLVIMVTHNPDLAETYSTRIIRMLDGRVTGDTNPTVAADEIADTNFKFKRTNMSFLTALSLSVSNLMTKKTRTILTAFAGSIGIIGIATILALSNGLQTYINTVERDTLSAYPITIEQEAMDIGGLMTAMSGVRPDGDTEEREADKIYTTNVLANMMNMFRQQVTKNDLGAFKKYIGEHQAEVDGFTTAVKYNYDVVRNLYRLMDDGTWYQVNPSRVFDDMGFGGMMAQSESPMGGMSIGGMSSYSNADMWSKLLPNKAFLETQYDVIAGKIAESAFEAVLIVREDNTVSDLMLYALGLKGKAEAKAVFDAIAKGEEIDAETLELAYNEIIGLEYALILPTDYYELQPNGTWLDRSGDELYVARIAADAPRVKIVGILRPNEDAASVSQNTTIGITDALDEYIINAVADSAIVKAQIANPDSDVFTGAPFATEEPLFATLNEFLAYVNTLPQENQTEILGYIDMMRNYGMTDDMILAAVLQSVTESESTYESNLALLHYTSTDTPTGIEMYASSFENKDLVEDFIAKYNRTLPDGAGITYTDYIGLLLSSVTTIINAISVVLIVFVSISLVVSSIMIGIITYISVLERTREIGVLRALGAAKRDISRVFNAETLFIGFAAGVIGIGVTLLLCIPANAIINNLFDIKRIAILPTSGAVALVLISMFLTFVAGLIPSRVAARKNPVEALRTE